MPAEILAASSNTAPVAPLPQAFSRPEPHHIRLTSHARGQGPLPIHWAAATAAERGPVVGTTTQRNHRNAIGTHSGSYSIYRALAVASVGLSPKHKAN